jgi:SAM-dependent methyltransferase
LGRVIAVGDELGRALGRVGLDVLCVAETERKKRKNLAQLVAPLEALPFEDASMAAVLVAGALAEPIAALMEFSRVVRDGGLVAVATPAATLGRRPAPPESLAAQLLHAALADVEQYDVGTTRISAGTVRRWGRPRL